jgi:hypothetical protein
MCRWQWPKLLIRRSRPRVRTRPTGWATRAESQSLLPGAFVVVQGRLCDLAPRMAPGSGETRTVTLDVYDPISWQRRPECARNRVAVSFHGARWI